MIGPTPYDHRTEDEMNRQDRTLSLARRGVRRPYRLLAGVARYAASNLAPSRQYRRGW